MTIPRHHGGVGVWFPKAFLFAAVASSAVYVTSGGERGERAFYVLADFAVPVIYVGLAHWYEGTLGAILNVVDESLLPLAAGRPDLLEIESVPVQPPLGADLVAACVRRSPGGRCRGVQERYARSVWTSARTGGRWLAAGAIRRGDRAEAPGAEVFPLEPVPAMPSGSQVGDRINPAFRPRSRVRFLPVATLLRDEDPVERYLARARLPGLEPPLPPTDFDDPGPFRVRRAGLD
ncbi:MAG: hypothetical protein ABII00_09315 [Elusimicrobiota bacterium]